MNISWPVAFALGVLTYLALQTASLSQRMDELDRRLTEQVAEVERQVVILRDGVW